MRRGIKLYIFIIGVIFMTFGPAIGRAEYDVIDITKPFLRKIPLAVPLFKNAGGSAEEQRSSEAAAFFPKRSTLRDILRYLTAAHFFLILKEMALPWQN
jgi:hypothetical protein